MQAGVSSPSLVSLLPFASDDTFKKCSSDDDDEEYRNPPERMSPLTATKPIGGSRKGKEKLDGNAEEMVMAEEFVRSVQMLHAVAITVEEALAYLHMSDWDMKMALALWAEAPDLHSASLSARDIATLPPSKFSTPPSSSTSPISTSTILPRKQLAQSTENKTSHEDGTSPVVASPSLSFRSLSINLREKESKVEEDNSKIVALNPTSLLDALRNLDVRGVVSAEDHKLLTQNFKSIEWLTTTQSAANMLLLTGEHASAIFKVGHAMHVAGRMLGRVGEALGPLGIVFRTTGNLLSLAKDVGEIATQVVMNTSKCILLARAVEGVRAPVAQLRDDIVSRFGNILTSSPLPTEGEVKSLLLDAEALIMPLETLTMVCKLCQDLVQEWSNTTGKKLHLTNEEKQAWRKRLACSVRKAISADFYETYFDNARVQLDGAMNSLMLALATRNYMHIREMLKKEVQQEKVWRQHLHDASLEDRDSFPLQLRKLAVAEAEFAKEVQAECRALDKSLLQVRGVSDLILSEIGSVSSSVEKVKEGVETMKEQNETLLEIVTSLKREVDKLSRSDRSSVSAIEGVVNMKQDQIKMMNVKVPIISFKDIEHGKIVGEGAFGEVHEGKWQGHKVAVKVLKGVGAMGKKVKKRLLEEAEVHCGVRHPHVIHFWGACTGKQCALVMEFAGPTLKFLLEEADDITWQQKWRIVLEVALGMGAVHRAGIVHHDLRAANILVGEPPRRCRIADFGLSEFRQQTSMMSTSSYSSNSSSSSTAGNAHWLAPEYTSGLAYTRKCDVFSYAVLMYEVATEGSSLPYAGRQGWQVSELYQKGKRGDNSALEHFPEEYRKLLETCWAQNPKERPTFDEIAARILSVGDVAKEFVVDIELEEEDNDDSD